jgi:hypothetical protein
MVCKVRFLACSNLFDYKNTLMKLHELPSQAYLKELFDYSVITGVLTYKKRTANRIVIGQEAGCVTPRGYKVVRIDGTTYFTHRLIWKWVTGEDPGDLQIDHVHDSTNNAWHNLRLATHEQNIGHQKVHHDNQLGVRGVRRLPNGTFQARIYHRGKSLSLGCYKSINQAADAYSAKENELRGEFTTVHS